MAKNEPIRLQKLLSQCGIASRRKAEQMIIDGHVKVNGKTAQLGSGLKPITGGGPPVQLPFGRTVSIWATMMKVHR